MKNETDNGLQRRLDVLVYILLNQTRVQEMNNREQIRLLYRLGLKDSEIATILGVSRGYVAGELSKSRQVEK